MWIKIWIRRIHRIRRICRWIWWIRWIHWIRQIRWICQIHRIRDRICRVCFKDSCPINIDPSSSKRLKMQRNNFDCVNKPSGEDNSYFTILIYIQFVQNVAISWHHHVGVNEWMNEMNEIIFFQHKQRATYNTTTGKSINAKKKAKNRQPNIN